MAFDLHLWYAETCGLHFSQCVDMYGFTDMPGALQVSLTWGTFPETPDFHEHSQRPLTSTPRSCLPQAQWPSSSAGVGWGGVLPLDLCPSCSGISVNLFHRSVWVLFPVPGVLILL